jgi:type IX secretion system PorP/SprF family membrane protein
MRLVLTLLFFFSFVGLYGQQIPQYTQWSMHQFAGNPAHAGIKPCVDLHSVYRMQWVGFEGAPKSGFFTLSVPIHSRRKEYLTARHGSGFKFETDKIGQFNVNRFNLAYAAHFNFDKYKRLSLGLYGGVMQMGYDPTNTVTSEPDPAAMNQGSIVAPDASFGAWFNAENFYVGLAFQNLIPSKWDNVGISSRNRLHMSLNGGYRFAIGDRFTLLPAMNIKVPASSPMAVDLNLHLDYNSLLGIGIGYRNTDALMAFFTLKIAQQFSIIYSFDYTLSDVQLAAKNTHEIGLQFTTCKRRKSSSSSCALFE